MPAPDPIKLDAQLTPTERALLQELAERFGVVLTQFFQRRVQERSEAEDLTQEVYVRLLKRGNIGTLENVRGYLFETASSVLTDWARKCKSRHGHQQDEFDPLLHGSADFPCDHVLIGKETLTRVTRAVLELPERTRTIFILRRLEGLQYQDIAQRLGVSLSLVEKQMQRAVAYLTQRMDEE